METVLAAVSVAAVVAITIVFVDAVVAAVASLQTKKNGAVPLGAAPFFLIDEFIL